jgi:hypothetical protein
MSAALVVLQKAVQVDCAEHDNLITAEMLQVRAERCGAEQA